MAMSNTLGSNTLDILLCLGLPWTIKTLMTGKNVNIISGALAYSIVSILICVIGFYAVIAFYGFKLNLKVGVACLFMYVLFLIVATLLELYIFIDVSGSTCQWPHLNPKNIQSDLRFRIFTNFLCSVVKQLWKKQHINEVSLNPLLTIVNSYDNLNSRHFC